MLITAQNELMERMSSITEFILLGLTQNPGMPTTGVSTTGVSTLICGAFSHVLDHIGR